MFPGEARRLVGTARVADAIIARQALLPNKPDCGTYGYAAERWTLATDVAAD